MMNTLGKMLVLFHTTMSLAGLTWAAVVFIQNRDFGWAEPAKQPVEFNSEGTPTKWVRHASEVDKSRAALHNAAGHRDQHYVYVKDAIDDLRRVEGFLKDNHLAYLAELDRLEGSFNPFDWAEPFEVRRLKDGGASLADKIDGKPDVGKPKFEADNLQGITKARSAYQSELRDLQIEIVELQKEIDKVNITTRRFTRELLGTDDDGKYIQPGLYDLIELEYRAQVKYKEELEDIKPRWSEYIEQARLHMIRRTDLEATLQRLKTPVPPAKKKL